MLCCLLLCVDGFAQKGMNGLGAYGMLGTRKGNVWTGVGLKYQHNFSNHFRLESSFNYALNNNASEYVSHTGTDRWEDYDIATSEAYITWQAMLNTHFLLFSPRPIRPFIIVGVGVLEWKSKYTIVGGTESDNGNPKDVGVAYDLGFGCDFRIGYHWTIELEAMTVSQSFSGAISESFRRLELSFKANIGLLYNF